MTYLHTAPGHGSLPELNHRMPAWPSFSRHNDAVVIVTSTCRIIDLHKNELDAASKCTQR